MAKMMLDFINATIVRQTNREKNKITYDEWCDIRRNGSPEEIEEAVKRMMAMGGYENLAQE